MEYIIEEEIINLFIKNFPASKLLTDEAKITDKVD